MPRCPHGDVANDEEVLGVGGQRRALVGCPANDRHGLGHSDASHVDLDFGEVDVSGHVALVVLLPAPVGVGEHVGEQFHDALLTQGCTDVEADLRGAFGFQPVDVGVRQAPPAVAHVGAEAFDFVEDVEGALVLVAGELLIGVLHLVDGDRVAEI